MSPRINLEENVGLISLVLRNAPSPFLRALLSTIPSSSVQSVTLFIPSFSGEDSEDFVELWSLRQLDGNHFEGLNQLVFVFRGDSRDRLITQQKVEEVYDTYTKAGMLKVIDMPEFERRCLGMGFGPSML